MDILDKIDILLADDFLIEGKFRKVIRKGKIVRKLFCPPGFKAVKGKCKKMKASEARKRSKATRKSQRSGKKAKLLRSRAKSMRKRGALIPTQSPPELKT